MYFGLVVDGKVGDDLLELAFLAGTDHQHVIGVDDQIVAESLDDYQFVFFVGDDDAVSRGVNHGVVAFD